MAFRRLATKKQRTVEDFLCLGIPSIEARERDALATVDSLSLR